MVRRWVPAAVLMGLLAGCSSTTGGTGSPEAAPATSAPPGLPVPDDPTEPPATSTPPPTTTAPATTPPAPTPAGPRCPADVAATMPGAGPATLVAAFRTARFRLYFCRTAGSQLYYRGISRADPRQATTLPARTIPGGYEARAEVDGDVFVYRVAQRRLVVTKNGTRILAETATAT
jgi:hypothetical protein